MLKTYNLYVSFRVLQLIFLNRFNFNATSSTGLISTSSCGLLTASEVVLSVSLEVVVTWDVVVDPISAVVKKGVDVESVVVVVEVVVVSVVVGGVVLGVVIGVARSAGAENCSTSPCKFERKSTLQ